jgi:hypothetical protein
MKRFLKLITVAIVSAACANSARADNATDAAKDPAFQQLKRLVGGVWRSKVEGTTVESRWKVGPDGVTLVGETIIAADTRRPTI